MTRQQVWALLAHELVTKMKGGEHEKEFATLCMSGPALLQRSGPLQALVFWRSRKEAGEDYVECLARLSTNQRQSHRSAEELVKLACEARLPEYLALSRDLLDISAWLRRFAQIELKGADTETGD